MDYTEARNTIFLQGMGDEDLPDTHAYLGDGFVGMLRPYQGLKEHNFEKVITAIVALYRNSEGRDFDNKLIRALIYIPMTARRYALDPTNMLMRNEHLGLDDQKKLLRWVQCIERAIEDLLSGTDPSLAIDRYS